MEPKMFSAFSKYPTVYFTAEKCDKKICTLKNVKSTETPMEIIMAMERRKNLWNCATTHKSICYCTISYFSTFSTHCGSANRKKGDLLDEASAMRFTLCHCDEVVLISFTAFENKGLALAFGLIKVKTFCHVLTCALEVKKFQESD